MNSKDKIHGFLIHCTSVQIWNLWGTSRSLQQNSDVLLHEAHFLNVEVIGNI